MAVFSPKSLPGSIIESIFSAVTATNTPVIHDVREYSFAGFVFTAASISAGNGVFTVEGSVDGDTFVALNLFLDNVTNSNVQNLTRVASSTLTTNTSKIYFLDLRGIAAIRVTVTVTTDGSYSCSMFAQK